MKQFFVVYGINGEGTDRTYISFLALKFFLHRGRPYFLYVTY